MCAIRSARPIPSRTPRATRASRSARAARRSRWARTTASRPAWSGCGCFPIPTSTSRRGGGGTRNGSTTTPTTIRIPIWSALTASACRADSATSDPTRFGRPPIRKVRGGRISIRSSAPSISGGTAFSTGSAIATPAASSIRRSTCRARARSTPRSSQPTTSTIRAA